MDKIVTFWSGLPYKTTGSILRAIRAALASGIAILVAANASGTLVPEGWAPIIAVAVTTGLLAADKFIREWRIEGEEKPDDEDVDDEPDDAELEPIPDPAEEEDIPEPEEETIDDAPIVEDPLVMPDITDEDAETETDITGV
jgi:hypothetical protein